MSRHHGNHPTPSLLLAACSAAAILAACCPAMAQTRPAGADVPHQTIEVSTIAVDMSLPSSRSA